MLQLMQTHLVATAVGVIVVAYIVRFIVNVYAVRKQLHKLPGPPHSMLWGHLIIMGETAASLPPRVHPHVFPSRIRKRFNLPAYFVLDVYPANDPMMVIMDSDICQQMSVEYQTKKHPSMVNFLKPLVGPDDMVSSNGLAWKRWRTMFNPGFSTQHLNTLVPEMVDDVLVYVDKLAEHADRNDVFRLEEDTTRLTIDVIGRVTLDTHFNMQRGENPCIQALREQVHLLPNQVLNPFEMWHPYGIYRRWRNQKIMVEYIGRILDERFSSTEPGAVKKQKKRSIIDLALDSYVSGEVDLEQVTSTGPPPKMDAEFKKGAITQIRTFLFAGHDTTSSTICYVIHLLKKHPSCLEKIRQEHERVLGPISGSADVIKREPHLLNRMEYTLAVIKETLRLYPAASAPRKGEPGLMVRDPQTGETFPTEGCMVWLLHQGLGRNPDVWGESAEEFEPARFLPENASRIPEGAWRPFETGARNCLGQNLALLESRIILALTCRQFDFTLALDSLDELKNDGSFYAKNDAYRQGKQDVDGEELYPILIGAAKPREGMPVRVKKVDWESK